MSDFSPEPCLAAAQNAARIAGTFLRKNFSRAKQVDEELAHDIKLRLDKDTQAIITAELQAAFPDIAILGEEGSTGSADAECRWIVDPLDGTVNYFFGIPIFAVSIALERRGELVLGCVYDPMQDEMFAAVAGGAATCNGRPIHVSNRAQMAQAAVFCGHGAHDGSGEAGIRRFARISSQVRKMRILGSAAVTLCYVAAGRMDAYIESRISLWDFAAARVILEAAGGKLEFTPREPGAVQGSVLAWNGLLPIQDFLSLS